MQLSAALFAVFAVFLVIYNAHEQQTINGRAATATISAKPQCSADGKIQFALSFTNPETFTVDLSADALIQQGTVSKDYFNISAGQTQTDILTTTVSSVTSGDVVFTWYPTGTTTTNNSQNFSYDGLTCSASGNPASSGTTAAQPAGTGATTAPGQTTGTGTGTGTAGQTQPGTAVVPTYSCLGCTPTGADAPTTDPAAPSGSTQTGSQTDGTTAAPTTTPATQNTNLIQLLIQLIIGIIKAIFHIN